jgi:hypothetical protein
MATLDPTEAAAATAAMTAHEKHHRMLQFFCGAPVYLPMGRYLLCDVTASQPITARPGPLCLVIIMRAIFAITLAVAAVSVSTIDGAALSGFVFSCDAHPACIGDGICVATWVVAICAQGCAH